MSERRFQTGDTVTVCMARNDCFPFQSSPRFEATITYIPGATGDCWQVVEAENGFVVLINPEASDFIGFVKTAS
jgi:hypothetical protein